MKVSIMNQVTSPALLNVGKGTAKKMSLERTTRRLAEGTVQT